jgi:hypothetical protein
MPKFHQCDSLITEYPHVFTHDEQEPLSLHHQRDINGGDDYKDPNHVLFTQSSKNNNGQGSRGGGGGNKGQKGLKDEGQQQYQKSSQSYNNMGS